MNTILFVDHGLQYKMAMKEMAQAGMVVIKFPRKLYYIAKFRYSEPPSGKITKKTLDKYINQFINNN